MATLIFNGTGQTLTHTPMGVASSVTFSLEDLTRATDDADRVLASGSPSVASWTLTTDEAAGPSSLNPRRIPVASTAGASIGAPALLVSPDGSRELVEVAALSANAYVEAAAPLAGSYPVGSTLYGVRITATISDAIAANEDIFDQQRELRIVWTYTVDGRVFRIPEAIQFLRHDSSVIAVASVVNRLVKMYPDIRARLPDQSNFEAIVSEVAVDVECDLRSRGIEPAQFLPGPNGLPLMCAAVVRHVASMGYAPGSFEEGAYGEYYRIADKQYLNRLDNLTIGFPNKGTHETNRDDQSVAPKGRGLTLRM